MARRRLWEHRSIKQAKTARQRAEATKNLPPPLPECERFAKYRTDPVAFAREVLRLFLYPRQEEILRALATTKKGRIAVRSGHKCGKSIVAVIAALWTVCCFPNARVLLTGPTARQVRDVLWSELRKVYRLAGGKPALGGHMAKTPTGGFKFEDGREIIGFSTDKAENMAGYSGPHVLWIIDEASGFDEKIFEAVDGNAQSGARIFAISNPTQTSGFFFNAFHSHASEWDRFRISAEEAAEYAHRLPGLSTKEEVAKRIARHGREHPIVRVRVLGEFPGAAANTIVSLHLVDQGHERWNETVERALVANFGNLLPEVVDKAGKLRPNTVGLELLAKCTGLEMGPLEIGVDVARFGDDDSAISPRRGKFLYPLVIEHGLDGVALASRAIAVAKQLRVPHERVVLKVDGIGAGASVVDQLREAIRTQPDLAGWSVVDINVAEKADDEEKYPNLRSQLWFAVANYLEEGGTLPPGNGEDEDGALDAELMAPVYKFDAKARQVVEPKADTKKRLNRSPDRADAVALAIYRGIRGGPPKTSNKRDRRYADMGGYGRG